MPAKNKPAPAPLTTTAADAHRHLLDGYTRKVNSARAEAKLEIERMQRRLARLAASLDAGQDPGLLDSTAIDSSALARSMTELNVASSMLRDAQGWINCINA